MSKLLDKINSGYFDEPLRDEINELEKMVLKTYDTAYKNYIGVCDVSREEAAQTVVYNDLRKLRRLKEKAHVKEQQKLFELRVELEKEFDIDLWDEITDIGGSTLIDVYNFYKSKTNK